MKIEKLNTLLSEGEGRTVEFKKCVNSLSSSLFETISSFSNRFGGYILLGIDDNGTVLGVNRNAVAEMKKNFVNSLNNPQKITPSLFINLEEIEYEDKLVLFVYVPISSQTVFCSGKVYDRIEDADIDITKSTNLMAELYLRKSNAYTERKIFPYITKEHLRMDLLPKVRQIAMNRNPNHPWIAMSDDDLFRSSGLYDEDFITGTKGFNMAAVLLFGRDEVIKSCVPGYVTDAIYRVNNLERYDDRLMVDTNLIESYDLLIEFIAKHSSDKFFLIDGISTSVRNLISRELVGNILTHREFSSVYPAKIIIEADRIVMENWNKTVSHTRIYPDSFTPYPKNPLLARFFVNIGRADTLGSGVRNLYKYTKMYSGGEPILIEDDVFTTTIPLLEEAIQESILETPTGILESILETPISILETEESILERDLSETQIELLYQIKLLPEISIKELAEQLNIPFGTVKKNIRTLVHSNVLVHEGSTKKGVWVIKKKIKK